MDVDVDVDVDGDVDGAVAVAAAVVARLPRNAGWGFVSGISSMRYQKSTKGLVNSFLTWTCGSSGWSSYLAKRC